MGSLWRLDGSEDGSLKLGKVAAEAHMNFPSQMHFSNPFSDLDDDNSDEDELESNELLIDED